MWWEDGMAMHCRQESGWMFEHRHEAGRQKAFHHCQSLAGVTALCQMLVATCIAWEAVMLLVTLFDPALSLIYHRRVVHGQGLQTWLSSAITLLV